MNINTTKECGSKQLDQFSDEWYSYIVKNTGKENEIILKLSNFLGESNEFWFMRKSFNDNNHIRLRVKKDVELSKDIIENFLKREKIVFNKIVYEPEFFLFGGESGLNIAHKHFCLTTSLFCKYLSINKNIQDFYYLLVFISNYIVKNLNDDNFEIWDCWNRVLQLRQFDMIKYQELINKNSSSFNNLINLDLNNLLVHYTLDLQIFLKEKYFPAIDELINCHKNLHYAGYLERGLRSSMAAIIIFNWNILGFKAGVQGGMAALFTESYKPI